jgi:N-acetylgalactosamine-N,N'-diacetylbacillosaminyl-diphospho-undecaprenol 4-alpha-N-acetylgalactosaminyltransferase
LSKQKLSILIYSLSGGGAERVVSILTDTLNQYYDITLILMNDTIFYEIPQNIKIIYLEKSNPKESGLLKLFKLPYLAYKYAFICKKNNIQISLSFMNRANYINIISKFFINKSNILISERATGGASKE